MKERKFLSGALTLSIAIVLVKLMGLLFVIPFSSLVGKEGMALYSYAYVPFSLFIDLSTIGIPLGLSKLIAKYDAESDFKSSHRLFVVSMLFMVLIGFIAAFTMYKLSPAYAERVLAGQSSIVNSVESITSILQIVAIALIVIPTMSVIRGFFQGKNNMLPTAISQVIEQFIRISFILISSFVLIKMLDGTYERAISYAVKGTVISAFVGFGVLIFFVIRSSADRQFQRNYESVKNAEPVLKLIKQLFIVALPFAIYGINLSLYQFIDSVTFNKAMLSVGETNPEYIYGIYAFEVHKIIFIPISLAVAFSSTLVPAISYDFAKNNLSGVEKNIIKAFQIIFFFTFPIVIYTMVFNDQIYHILFGNNPYGGNILLTYAPLILIFSLNSVSMSIIQGINRHKYLFFTILIGVLIKLTTNYIFIVFMGVDGAILSSALGLITTVTLNFVVIQHYTEFEFNYLLKRFLFIIFLSVVMGIILIFIDQLLELTIDYKVSKLSNLLYLFITFIIGLVLYFVMGLYTGLLRIITESKITYQDIMKKLKISDDKF
ncbi:polysaccharide biosynthesis protein [Mycoplasmatota bacterium zrk1]